MQTIATKFICPANFKGSRISATSASGKKVILSWDDALNAEDNHMAAVKALCAKLDWKGKLAGGHTKNGMIWVFVDKPFACEVTVK